MGLKQASYREFSPSQWREKVDFFDSSLEPCRLCPRQCRSDRRGGAKGACQAEVEAKISSFGLHFGEEPPISGFRGSGTVFFSGCTLKCVFCQNWSISQGCEGEFYSIEELAGIYLYLQKQGAHNINLVSPTPYLFHIVAAMEIAAHKGLSLPFVYNTGGYERLESVRQLQGLVAIYMPDLKYSGSEYGRRLSAELSGAGNYFEHAFPAGEEMYRQAGPMELDADGIGIRGTLVRQLILPGHVRNSLEVLEAMAAGPLRGVYLSLMSQYHPAFRACERKDICRRLSPGEYRQVKERALALGFSGWFQDLA